MQLAHAQRAANLRAGGVIRLDRAAVPIVLALGIGKGEAGGVRESKSRSCFLAVHARSGGQYGSPWWASCTKCILWCYHGSEYRQSLSRRERRVHPRVGGVAVRAARTLEGGLPGVRPHRHGWGDSHVLLPMNSSRGDNASGCQYHQGAQHGCRGGGALCVRQDEGLRGCRGVVGSYVVGRGRKCFRRNTGRGC